MSPRAAKVSVSIMQRNVNRMLTKISSTESNFRNFSHSPLTWPGVFGRTDGHRERLTWCVGEGKIRWTAVARLPPEEKQPDNIDCNVVQIMISRNFVCRQWRSKRVRGSEVMKNHKVVIGRGSGYISRRGSDSYSLPRKGTGRAW